MRWVVNTKRMLSIGLLALAGLIMTGCEQIPNQVVASTGTIIGLDLSLNPATQMPQGKLGYNRAELAIVPTNRGVCYKKKDSSGWECTNNYKNGAVDSAEVLMELYYKDVFSRKSSIYQRLAVGKIAVQQAGAAFMFARDPEGKVDPATAGALAASLNAKALALKQVTAVGKIAILIAENKKMSESKLIALFKCNGYSDADANRIAGRYKDLTKVDFLITFSRDFGWSAPAMLEKSKGCNI